MAGRSTKPQRVAGRINTVDGALGLPPGRLPVERGSLATVTLDHAPTTSRAGPIIRTAAALLSVQGVTWATSLVSILFIPRFLGASRLGVFASAGTLAAILGLTAGFGTSAQIVKSVARDRDNAANVVVHAMALRVAIWLAFLLPTMAITLTVVEGNLARFVLAVMIGSTVFGLISDAANAGLQGNQTMGKAAMFAALFGVAAQCTTVGILLLGGGLFWLVSASALFAPIYMAVPVTLFWRRLGRPIHWSRPLAASLIAGGLPFLAWDLALRLYGSIDYLLLAGLTNSATVGEYAFAHRLAEIPIFGTTVVTAAVYPALSAAAFKDRAFFKGVVTNATRAVILITLPMAAGLIVLAPELTKLIGGGGGQFKDAAPLLMILSLHIPLAAMDTILGTALFAMDRQKRVAIVGCGAAVLNPVINLAAIPLSVSWFGNGAIGASVITVATECFVGAWIWTMLGANIERKQSVRVAALSLCACGAMVAVVELALGPLGLFAAIGAGAVVYVAAIIALRLVTPAEARHLRSAIASP